MLLHYLGKQETRKLLFSLKCCMLVLPQNTKHTEKYHLVRTEPPFTVKMIDWVHHTGPRKEA